MYTVVKCVLLLSVAVAVSCFTLGPQDVVFHLFTKDNPGVSEPLLPDVTSISQSQYLSLTRRTYFTIHSNGESAVGNFNAYVIPAHLSNDDVNVIAVDWSLGSVMYSQGLGNAPQVGSRVTAFIDILLKTFNYDVNLITIVGVGLGGHIAGIAARNVRPQIPHIIAIDPSLYGWTHHPDILSPDDAKTVEVLHATAGQMGYDWPLGDIDFYANGGSIQNGCSDTTCSHTLAYIFYAESITAEVNNGPKFYGTACMSYEQAVTSSCAGPRDIEFGGTSDKTRVSGIYTFTTRLSSPYALD